MTAREDLISQTALILSLGSGDGETAAGLLAQAGVAVSLCRSVEDLCGELAAGAGFVLLTRGAADLEPFEAWLAGQAPWSDLPVVLLVEHGGGLEHDAITIRLTQTLGNVTVLERPFHPTSLVSVAQAALRGRRRQYEDRRRNEEIHRTEAELEHRVHERTAELASANRQLLAQIDERGKVEAALFQDQRLEAVGQLTSGVAHDFNNLLTVVLGNVRQLAKAEANPSSRRRLDMMEQAAQRGAKLTAQLLAFSRRQKLAPQLLDLNLTVARMLDLLQGAMAAHAHIEVDLARDLWQAMIDPAQIELVILNLAINARDAMTAGGVVTVSTGNVTLGPPRRPEEPPAGDYVMVAVSDAGSGMTPEVVAKAFEPFFTTKPLGQGSGLGLSQVFGLAKQSGGGVSIQTAPGEGSSVKVYLPRAEADAESYLRPSASAA